ncbi:MAG TPA: AMP-binding protein, partial [Longimicrobiales bacterium]|nr:AMP-binding protein [Longimicrobiales bacterium]
RSYQDSYRSEGMDGFVPWPEEYARQYRQAGYWLDRTITDVLDERFRRFAPRTALICDDGRAFTYEELGRLSTRLALHLNRLGLRVYDRVLLQLPNTAEAVISYVGTLKAGGVPIMALAAHREAEIGHFAQLSEARAYLAPAVIRGFDFQEMAEALRGLAPSLDLVLISGGPARPGNHRIEELLADPIEERVDAGVLPYPDPDLPAVLQLSGGTTGIPKLIPRTHNDYGYNFLRNAEVCELDESTVMLIPIPQGHNFALACPGLMGVLAVGGCEVLAGHPSMDHLLPLMERHGVTHFVGVPTLILALLNHPKRKEHDLSSLRCILTGGSKLNPEVAFRIKPELECDVQQVLGMAEGPLYWTRLDDPEEVRLCTQGRPQSPGDEFRIVNPGTDEDAKPGEMGELWCRGPHTIRGYYRAAEHNAKAFSPDGFYKSGDLVRLHPSGNVVVEGRIKDCINRGGEKISAEEIENHILAHPGVANCAVVAMPDELLGERACAYVVLQHGQELSLSLLSEFLLNTRKIARFKVPERLEVVDAFPLTNVGKINKKALRERIAAECRVASGAS